MQFGGLTSVPLQPLRRWIPPRPAGRGPVAPSPTTSPVKREPNARRRLNSFRTYPSAASRLRPARPLEPDRPFTEGPQTGPQSCFMAHVRCGGCTHGGWALTFSVTRGPLELKQVVSLLYSSHTLPYLLSLCLALFEIGHMYKISVVGFKDLH